MKKIIFLLLLFPWYELPAQNSTLNIAANWQFRKKGTSKWLSAKVPGTIHTDLLQNKHIPDPFFRDNEKRLQWIDSVDWEYRVIVLIGDSIFKKKNINLVFDGLDTYGNVYLNKQLVLQTNNMFRQWNVNIKPFLNQGNNELVIQFRSAKMMADSMARAILPLVLPDNNRVHVRKAQFQFGWDWGPTFVGGGIWKKVWIDAFDSISTVEIVQKERDRLNALRDINTQLVQQPDETGVSFAFQQNGLPLYAKGANWIPAHIFLPEVKKEDYRKLLTMAKEANMNMLRVWGGGVYESDEFYNICDELGIKVWQDFMFAGGMYPGDEAFYANVKQEVKYQVERLRHHPCIIVWCGNNEISEAWQNWGWQKQFNIHGKDSVKIWKDYLALFNDSLRSWVNEYDCTRPYIETSPQYGWGRAESMTSGDSHYWGLWWGLQDWEIFKTKTGRFVSEYGMQSMPNTNTINSFTLPADRKQGSAVITAHQKASDGFNKLNHYLTRYFIDSSKLVHLNLEKYSYLTQCLQAYILYNVITIHRSKFPTNMGTLLWQLNDCWPVTSWSIIDHSGSPKAAWYAVKRAYADNVLHVTDSIEPKKLALEKPVFRIKKISANSFSIEANTAAKYVYLNIGNLSSTFSDNYFDLQAGEIKNIFLKEKNLLPANFNPVIISLYDILN